jgi:hypothetical protein
MKDYLLDLIQHTHGLGEIDLVKISGTDKETQISAVAENKSVIITGSFKSPIADFIGTFGMPNLSKLKTIVGFDEYDDTSKINVTRVQRDNEEIPTTIHFETSSGDFINDYRLMSKAIVEEKVRTLMFKGANWNVEFEPSVAGILRLKKQASANSEEQHFTMTTSGSDLKISFGDPSTHSGNFVFQTGVTGKLSQPWKWPAKVFQSIMDLPGDKTIKVADQGATEITVDSPFATYRYLLPAQAK